MAVSSLGRAALCNYCLHGYIPACVIVATCTDSVMVISLYMIMAKSEKIEQDVYLSDPYYCQCCAHWEGSLLLADVNADPQ